MWRQMLIGSGISKPKDPEMPAGICIQRSVSSRFFFSFFFSFLLNSSFPLLSLIPLCIRPKFPHIVGLAHFPPDITSLSHDGRAPTLPGPPQFSV